MATRRPRICLFGASDDTGNLGVSALMTGTLLGLAKRHPMMHMTVFDHGLGHRDGELTAPDGQTVPFDRRGARIGRRYHRAENLWTMSLAARIGGWGNARARAVTDADVVLDISGGDSFTDLYGQRRFDQVIKSKLLALRCGTPLVLLPQTYGPFRQERNRNAAADVLRRSTLAYARGADGFRALQDLLGNDFDPTRHRQGVDVALTMPPRPVNNVVGQLVRRDGRPIIGLNVSGLLFGRTTRRYDLTIAYDRAILELVQRLLANSDARIVLIPHVTGQGESDAGANRRVADVIADPARVVAAPPGLDAQSTKWLISQTDWFCGTRMHATIAALSTGTPVAAIAYSHKTREVFETCGIPDEVADARELSTTELVDQLWGSWTRRDLVTAQLAAARATLLGAAERQLDEIAAACGVRVSGSAALPR
ncbi:polysaccharide pyruvyl transferase family protein [Euzebya tangerina]|uniref:polysaccharide pyruvyl transferase family protein n=1 Tax=Euzebya tangerina TaxID=591198 RepID=UPI002F2EED30